MLTVRTGGGRKRFPWKKFKTYKRTYFRVRKARRTLRALYNKDKTGDARPTKLYFGEDFAGATENQKALRSAVGWRGKGDYKSVLKYASRGLGALAGGAIGFMTGGPAGAATGAAGGWNSGAGFSKWAGWGDYGPISTNQIMGGGEGPMQTATVNQSMSGDVIIQNSEFIGNVSASNDAAGTSGFQLTKYEINPGLAGTFPFLSQLAQNYQMYEFAGLIFQYKPTSGEGNSVNANAIGKVVMATQYDPDATDFFDSIQMENYEWSNASKPSCGMLHGVETLPSQKVTNQLYVRTGNSTKNKIFTDLGSFYIATEGIPFNAAGTVNCGELWVTYTIKLSRANLYGSLLGYNIPMFYQQKTADGVVDSPANSLLLKVKQTTATGLGGSSLYDFEITFPINIQLGYFTVCMQVEKGADQTAIAPNSLVTVISNGVVTKPSGDIPSSELLPATGGTVTQTNTTLWLQVNAPGSSQCVANVRFVGTGGLVASVPASWFIFVSGANGAPFQNPL